MLFGIAGPTASGKTTVTDMLVRELAAEQMRYSAILAETATERGLDATDKATLQELYITLREERGEDWLAQEIAARAKARAAKHLIIEGNRRKVDLKTLETVAKDRDEDWTLIFIDASPDTRFARYNARLEKQGKSPISREAFDELEHNPTEDEVDDLRQYAKAHGIYIDTDAQSIPAMESTVKTLLRDQK